MLDGSTRKSPKHRGCTPVLEGSFKFLDATFSPVSSGPIHPHGALLTQVQNKVRIQVKYLPPLRSIILNISTDSARYLMDGSCVHQIWYPPPSACEEDRSQVHPSPEIYPSASPSRIVYEALSVPTTSTTPNALRRLSHLKQPPTAGPAGLVRLPVNPREIGAFFSRRKLFIG